MAERTDHDPDRDPVAASPAGAEHPAGHLPPEPTGDDRDWVHATAPIPAYREAPAPTDSTEQEDGPVVADEPATRTATAAAAAAGASPARPRRKRAARNKWQVLGLAALALVGALLLGWFGGLLAGKAFGPEQPKPSAAATKTTDAKATGEGTTPGESIKITGASLFDPPPGDGQENPDRIALSYDGQPGTTWPTLQYKGSAKFGNLKPGVGIVYDLGAEKSVSKVQIRTTLPGATVEIRTGAASGGTLDQFPAVAGPVQLQETTDIPLPGGTKTRYVLVWITQLVNQQGFYQASLSEVGIIS
ncbi:hypothetical protein [Cumulibacter manganitolerans]|uniref:hypothetical protein n=1 Tax=Cumulibacter manganitolerans TaxID=1884992 RepID=UPI001295DA8E|nr:hypothetical protein [Cumulibacter manganitolerans]